MRERFNIQDGRDMLLKSYNLREFYARYQKEKIGTWVGFTEKQLRDGICEKAAQDSLEMKPTGSKNFMQATDIVKYLARNYDKTQETYYVNVVIPGLYWKYYENKDLLSADEAKTLDLVGYDLPPTFRDIFKYKSLQKFENFVNIREYQLFGTLTCYDILHIPVKLFIEKINNNEPINVKLAGLNIVIQLQYEKADFLDEAYGKLVEQI